MTKNIRSVVKDKDKGEEESSESCDDSEDEIALDGNISNKTIHEFEFNDISEVHIDSITVLLKTLIPNPTIAYSISQLIYQQSNFIIIKITRIVLN
jgi:hypothetical protein